MEAHSPTGAVSRIASPPELAFSVTGVEAERFVAVPTLAFDVSVVRLGGGAVRSIALNVQFRIAATRRSYDERAEGRLVELFGRPEQWGRSLQSIHWTNVNVNVPAFVDSTTVRIPVVCTYDFEVTTAKYFHALEDGEVPLELLFGGTVFYAEPDGQLRIALVPWSSEAEYRLPVAVYREMMDRHFPGSAWLRLRRESFDRLYAYKAGGGFLTWEDALDSLLGAARDE